MNLIKAKKVLKESGFWTYYRGDCNWSNGKRQLTFLNNSLFINEHHFYNRGRMKDLKIHSIKQLKEFINSAKKE